MSAHAAKTICHISAAHHTHNLYAASGAHLTPAGTETNACPIPASNSSRIANVQTHTQNEHLLRAASSTAAHISLDYLRLSFVRGRVKWRRSTKKIK
eukprot:2720813-Rhodomonas_salina.2